MTDKLDKSTVQEEEEAERVGAMRREVREVLRRRDHEAALQLTREEIASVSPDEQAAVAAMRRELRRLGLYPYGMARTDRGRCPRRRTG